MTDRQLYQLCKKFGRRVLEARRKFLGLLPEVARRQLWRARGFGSIYEFAAKLAGLGRDQVDEVLRLERRFVSIPVLREALVSGEVGVTKLARVAAVATAENAGDMLGVVKRLSYAALDIKVKEIKAGQEGNTQAGDGLFELESVEKSLCAQTLAQFGISEEIAGKLQKLKDKGFDLNQLLGGLLEKREEAIQSKKES